MLRIAFVGQSRAGKSSAINALTGWRSAPIGLGNTTKTVTKYGAKIDGIDCTLIDTPADYPLSKLPEADVVLYVAEVGEIDNDHWTKFRTYYIEFNKTKSVPVQIAILITKCDSHPTPINGLPKATTSQMPPNILIAEDDSEIIDELGNYYDQAIIDAINATTKKYSEICPVIPFNAFGRIAKFAFKDMVKVEGRKALSFGYINFDISQFCINIAEFQGLRQIMAMTDTLIKDIKKYNTCIYCGNIATCNCCTDFSNQAPISDVYYRVSKGYHTPAVGQHFTVYKPVGCNGGIARYCLYCLMYDDSARITPSMGPTCTPKEKNCVSKFRCRSGYRACAFNIAHPCGQIASKLIELYSDNKSIRPAIIQFALNGQSQFGKSPNYNPEYWNIMATHLTFDRADLASFKPKTKDEAFRLLQFSRQRSIVEKIDLYCAALRLPVESPNSLRIKCVNGEMGIFADRPIKNISDLKLVFNLIPTKRTMSVDIDQLFSDLGEKQTYSPEILAEMPAIVKRINVKPEHYNTRGLFMAF